MDDAFVEVFPDGFPRDLAVLSMDTFSPSVMAWKIMLVRMISFLSSSWRVRFRKAFANTGFWSSAAAVAKPLRNFIFTSIRSSIFSAAFSPAFSKLSERNFCVSFLPDAPSRYESIMPSSSVMLLNGPSFLLMNFPLLLRSMSPENESDPLKPPNASLRRYQGRQADCPYGKSARRSGPASTVL